MATDQRATSDFFLDTAANLKVFGEAQRAELMLRCLADVFRAIAYGNLAQFNQEITRLGLFGPDEHKISQTVSTMLTLLARDREHTNPALAALYMQAADALVISEPAPIKPWSRSSGA